MRKPFLGFLLSFFINYVAMSAFCLRDKSFNEDRNHHQYTIGTALTVGMLASYTRPEVIMAMHGHLFISSAHLTSSGCIIVCIYKYNQCKCYCMLGLLRCAGPSAGQSYHTFACTDLDSPRGRWHGESAKVRSGQKQLTR